ncbi:SGNH/GDSL hydrolase family protein [Streptococcus gallolyticus]|nr:SGNH/GDSL hydrolase family protein [Streptococcus gallolyticus]MBY5040101.1 SGNH/GDSL hydrolase family protein [Streptococcus gallolyticus]
MNNRKILQGLVFFFTSLLGFLFLFQALIPTAPALLTKKDYEKTVRPQLHYVALGDSLTQGVGDSTNQGGFVPLLSQSLTNEYGYEVIAENYGISGNTSKQILVRIQEDSQLAASLKKADVMTLTVGGNDLRYVILNNIQSLKISTFTKPAKAYSKRLKKIIETARQENKDLPIYVLGIYNPYYLNFPEMTDMQTIVDNWNETTQASLKGYDNVYFVPINDLLYQGLNGQDSFDSSRSSSSSQTSTSSSQTNNLLYEGDNFHPNNTGYEIMKAAVMEKIHETKDKWKN